MLEVVLELTSRAEDVAVRLLNGDNADLLAEALVPRSLLDDGDPRLGWSADEPVKAGDLTPQQLGLRLGIPGADIRIGRYLHAIALPEPVATPWRALKHAADDGLVTLLEIRPPEADATPLHELPWELLYDDGLYLFRDQKSPMALRLAGARAAAVQPRWPLRMLVLVGVGDEGQQAEDKKIAWW